MRRYFILFAAPAMAFSLTACEAETPRTVTVTAIGTAQAEATHFQLLVRLVARGETRDEAAQAAEALSAGMRDTLPRLEGLESLEISTQGFQLITLCAGEDVSSYRQNPALCQATGYAAVQGLVITGSPAEQGANAASLASQLGAQYANLNEYSSDVMDAARQEAMLAAAREARARAERIAVSLGVALGPVISVTPPEFGGMLDPLAIPNSPPREMPETEPSAQLDVRMSAEPGPITVREQLTFVFQLVDASADGNQ